MTQEAFDIQDLKGLSADSRTVRPGYLFAALPGVMHDGHDYIGDAIQRGAAAVLARPGTVLPAGSDNITLITDTQPRRKFAHMAAAFYDTQPAHIIAVTGTNGKTSVVHFLEQLWQAGHHHAATIGTLTGTLTTPDSAALHRQLADMHGQGITHVAVEASSHGLDQYRLDGLKPAGAGFTNLSRDHLDYHENIEAYFKAKARLFTDLLPAAGFAVLNADDAHYDALRHMCADAQVLSYGFKGQDIRLTAVHAAPEGQRVEADIFGRSVSFHLPLVGGFQVMNALCALGLALAGEGAAANPDTYLPVLETLKPVPGRVQFVPGHPAGASVYIDYAHTPDALMHVLKALRAHTPGRLICLFGCGGDRDQGKRLLMGQVAERFADQVIVTDDNPRSEDPARIRQDILAGAPDAINIEDRRQAIRQGVSMLSRGDVLLIAGKGHEQGQIFADYTEDFDDNEEAEYAIQALKSDA